MMFFPLYVHRQRKSACFLIFHHHHQVLFPLREIGPLGNLFKALISKCAETCMVFFPYTCARSVKLRLCFYLFFLVILHYKIFGDLIKALIFLSALKHMILSSVFAHTHNSRTQFSYLISPFIKNIFQPVFAHRAVYRQCWPHLTI